MLINPKHFYLFDHFQVSTSQSFLKKKTNLSLNSPNLPFLDFRYSTALSHIFKFFINFQSHCLITFHYTYNHNKHFIKIQFLNITVKYHIAFYLDILGTILSQPISLPRKDFIIETKFLRRHFFSKVSSLFNKQDVIVEAATNNQK